MTEETKDCDECEGHGCVTSHCENCDGNGERWEGTTCGGCRGLGEFDVKCEAEGCEDGKVDERSENLKRVEVLADKYSASLKKLSE